MESNELIKAWQASEKSLEKLWNLNIRAIEMAQMQKAKSRLNALAHFKLGAIALGLIYVSLLGFLVYANGFRNPFFCVSLGIILLVTLLAMLVYIRHLLLIRQINFSESLVETQERLVKLRLSTLSIYRILWLQLPCWSTFFWNGDWIVNHTLNFLLTAFPITLFFTWLSVWLYKHIRMENSHKKWFRVLFNSTEWLSITRAMAFMDEIDSFKRLD